MKKYFLSLACISLSSLGLAQNNPQVFFGGIGEGSTNTNFSQPTILTIVNGGAGDGVSSNSYSQSTVATLINGGQGDGHSMASYSQATANTLVMGGQGDGHSKAAYEQASDMTLVMGGQGDGHSTANYIQASDATLVLGGAGDGFSTGGYIQSSDLTLVKGGIGDGWASVTLPLVPLPINILSFTGKKLDNTSNFLEWNVTGVMEGDKFELLRSNNSQHYAAIATIHSRTNSDANGKYDFIDKSPITGKNFYQLKIVHLDGTEIRSNVVLLINESETTIAVYPNPTASLINIEFSTVTTNNIRKISMLNIEGKEVLNYELNGNKAQLNIKHLAAGNYFLKIIDNGKVTNLKVTKF